MKTDFSDTWPVDRRGQLDNFAQIRAMLDNHEKEMRTNQERIDRLVNDNIRLRNQIALMQIHAGQG